MEEPNECCVCCNYLFGARLERGVKVTCSGPCRRTFHVGCVNLDVEFLDACTEEDTISWFCAFCRQNFADERAQRQALPVTIERMCVQIRQQVAVQCDIVASDTEKIPVEIWATVFRKLNLKDWRNARLVNNLWKNIVDGDRLLMNKFIMKYPRRKKLGCGFAAVSTLPASNILFEATAIVCVGSWWSRQITEKLANLEFKNCSIRLKVLLTMLRHTPNLVSLNLSIIIRNETVEEFSDLQLQKMEKLTLGCVKQDEILQVFSRLCPKLKDFTLLHNYYKCYRGVLEMIKALPTLEGISLVSSSNDLSHLVEVNHRFRRVSIKISPFNELANENLISFSEMQPLLESFNLEAWKLRWHISNRVLTKVFKNLPRLKRLSVRFRYNRDIRYEFGDGGINLQSVGYLTELEHLSVCGGSGRSIQPLFAGAKSPKLKELFLIDSHLTNITVYQNYALELREYISNASNLRNITLEDCFTGSWLELFTGIQSNGLRRLKMSHIQVCFFDVVCLYTQLDTLRYLEMKSCKLTEQFFSALFDLCPQLEELHLEDMESVCDAVVLVVCQKLKQLKKLTISKCAITDASVGHITGYGLNPEQLTITDCTNLTAEGVAQLEDAKIAIVEIKYVSTAIAHGLQGSSNIANIDRLEDCDDSCYCYCGQC